MKKKRKHPRPLNPNECVLCGARVTLQSGLQRCTDKTCGHIQKQTYAFQPTVTREPTPRYQPYERQTAKPVDKEFK